MNEDFASADAGAGPPAALLQLIRTRARQIGKTRLLPLTGNGGALAAFLAGRSSLTGEIDWPGGRRSGPFRFLLNRIGDDPPTFCLEVSGLPEGSTPLAVFLSEFDYWQFESPKARLRLVEASQPSPRKESSGAVPAEKGVLRLVADAPADIAADAAQPSPRRKSTRASGAEKEPPSIGAETFAHSDSYSLSADDEDRPRQPKPLVSAESPDVAFEYFADGTLEVTAKLPEGSDGETVIAELRSGSGTGAETVRRAVHLDHRLEDGRYKRNLSRFLPAAQPGAVELVVRPLTDADLFLLEPSAVQSLLARQDYVSMPVEQTDEGLVFRARWPDQQQAAAAPTTFWGLAVAMGEEG